MEKSSEINLGKGLHEQYHAIDLVKFIMALSVVAIHTKPLIPTTSLYYKLYESFIYLSVPFFFIASGYLLSGKYENEKKMIPVLRKHILKLIRLYCIWSIVYFPLALYAYHRGNHSILHCTLDYIRGFFIFGEHYNSYILWYLLSSIYALLFIILLKRWKKSNKFILLLGFLIGICACILTLYANNKLEISGLAAQKCFDLLVKIFVNGRIFTGFFYIPLGMCLHDNIKLKTSNGIYFFIVGLIFETVSPGIGFVYEGGRIVAATGLFLFALNIKLKDNIVYAKLRFMSTTIYFTHLWIWTIVYTLIYHEKKFGIVPFFLTVLLCLIVGYLYQKAVKVFQCYFQQRS